MLKKILCITLLMLSLAFALCSCDGEQTNEPENPAHFHAYGNWETTKVETCTEEGNKTRVCTVCGYCESVTVESKGHSFGDWKTICEPSCNENGTKERICDCGKVESILINAEHSFVGNSCTKCNEKKPTEGLVFSLVSGGYEVSKGNNISVVDNELVIPSTYNGKPVVKIADRAFQKLDGFSSVTIGKYITTIGAYAFYYCKNLTGVTFSDNIVSIGASAFYHCDSLTSVTFSDSIVSVGGSAFDFCDNLENVHINSLLSWCNIDFENGYANPLINSSANLYLNAALVTKLVIPEGVTEIKDYAFYYYRKLKSVETSDTVTKIGKDAFFKCANLETVIISDSVLKIGKEAFWQCSNLSVLYLGKGLKEIQADAFGCPRLKSAYYSGTKSKWDEVFVDSEAFDLKITIYFDTKQPQ